MMTSLFYQGTVNNATDSRTYSAPRKCILRGIFISVAVTTTGLTGTGRVFVGNGGGANSVSLDNNNTQVLAGVNFGFIATASGMVENGKWIFVPLELELETNQELFLIVVSNTITAEVFVTMYLYDY